jgi:hypothetical protein
MALQPKESSWTHAFGVAIVFFFFCISVGHLVKPDYFLRRSGVRKGGEMLTVFNRMGFRFVGLIGALFSGFLLFELMGNFLAK